MEREIEISVKDLVAWQTNFMDYICGNGKFVASFLFDEEWEEYEIKTARFKYNGIHKDVVFSGNKCAIPKILNANKIEVGVYGANGKATTPAVVNCRKSILCGFGVPAEPDSDVFDQIMEQLNSKRVGRLAEITLFAEKWEGSERNYSQVVTIPGITKFSQVDLTPSNEQLEIFHNKDLALVAENEDGVVTVYAIGDKPTGDYTMQVTIYEVSA